MSWQWDVPALVITAGLAVGYGRALIRRNGHGVGWARGACFLIVGCATWALATTSFVGVYADTLFWVRALQVVLLLFVVPFGLALGKPVTVLRTTLDAGGAERLDAMLAGRPARILLHPATTSVAMLATPWLLYLTAWYPAALHYGWVDQLTRLVLVAVGFGYFYARLQADPVPRRYSQMISLTITTAEMIGDGLLGLVLWLGPDIAAEYYDRFARGWGPDPRTDQIIGAGILWLLGDVIGIPFLMALMRAFVVDERAAAIAIDAHLDAAEPPPTPDVDHRPPAESSSSGPPLWWEHDPQLQERFRRRR
ncbi:cytochrome c oxidase assembly protein [Millisia brevis]|uniref:cytochrome c oxidase assembly protein n=1 Tax=Millisia brevis TaxID=264148 RepID=UPI0008319408|nr:cytochrome c oxidase assembly protein [Millisia brevis]